VDVSGDVRAYGVSGDDPRKGRFEDPRKEPRAPNPNILGPIFTSKAIFGRFRTRSRGFLFRRFWADF
jgi:hypothetical protein